MKNKKPNPIEIEEPTHDFIQIRPYTVTAQSSSIVFPQSPSRFKVTSDLEYVPFERVYYEREPVKRIEYVSVPRKVVDYMPVQKTRYYSPVHNKQSLLNVSPTMAYTRNFHFGSQTPISQTILTVEPQDKSKKNFGLLGYQNNPPGDIILGENEMKGLRHFIEGVLIKIEEGEPLKQVIEEPNQGEGGSQIELLDPKKPSETEFQVIKTEIFDKADDDNENFDEEVKNLATTTEPFQSILIGEEKNPDNINQEIVVEPLESLLVTERIQEEGEVKPLMNDIPSDVLNILTKAVDNVMYPKSEQYPNVKSEPLEEIHYQPFELQPQNEADFGVPASIQNVNEAQLRKQISLQNPMDLIVTEPEIKGPLSQSLYFRNANMERGNALYTSQGPYVPNRTSYPIKPSNPILIDMRNYSPNMNRARFESGDNFPDRPNTVVINNGPFQRLQSFETANRESFGFKSVDRPHMTMNNVPFQRLQSIETVNRESFGFASTPFNNRGVAYRLVHQNLPLQVLESGETPVQDRISLTKKREVTFGEPDFGLVGEIRNADGSIGKIRKVEEAPKINKAQNRVLVPPIREGSMRNTFQLPTLRHTNNEYILEALKQQERINQNFLTQMGGVPVNYYVSPYLKGYLDKK